MKIVDVSLRSGNLGGLNCGPKENDIVRYLKQYASEFGHEFVPYMLGGDAQGVKHADVVFTNDVWPKTVFWEGDDPFPGKFKVKRMDGVFSRADTVHRNEALNKAAQQADHVIFISEYSKESYFRLYDESGKTIKSFSVIRNEADPRIFHPGFNWSSMAYNPMPREVIAVASDWSRPEKRFNDLLVLAKFAPDTEFVLVGKPVECSLPKNVRLKGYIDSPQGLADALRLADAMVSLSYKDPYPKTMVQGRNCGLPILYAASGGQTSMGVTGVPVLDFPDISFDREVPRLNPGNIEGAWWQFRSEFYRLKPIAMQYNGRDPFIAMLRGYFEAMEG